VTVKNSLRALAVQFVTDWFQMRLAEQKRWRPSAEQSYNEQLMAEPLARGIREFADTPGEVILRIELLRLQERKKDFAGFLDGYLQLIYLKPACPELYDLLAFARVAASQTCRKADLTRALRFHSLFPDAFRNGHGPAPSSWKQLSTSEDETFSEGVDYGDK
jgi:hypothetical protein